MVVAGRMGTGKSTLARRLARALSAELVVADALREAARRRGEPGAELPGFSRRIYPRMFATARRAILDGRPVVLDGTFRSRALRARARALARDLDVPFVLVEARADDETVRRRLARRPDPGGWLALFDGFQKLWEPVDELPAAEHRRVDTSGPPERLEDAVPRIVRDL